VALDYGAATAEIAWLDHESTADNVRRILSRRGTIPIRATFLAPIDPAAGDRKSIAATAREEIVAALNNLQATSEAGRASENGSTHNFALSDRMTGNHSC